MPFWHLETGFQSAFCISIIQFISMYNTTVQGSLILNAIGAILDEGSLLKRQLGTMTYYELGLEIYMPKAPLLPSLRK